MLDCLIIGGGPAGLTAAVYLARFRRTAVCSTTAQAGPLLFQPAIITLGSGASRDLISLHGCASRILKMVPDWNKDASNDCIVRVTFIAQWVGEGIAVRTVFLATGLVDECPDIEGTGPDLRKGALPFCLICDGYEAKDRRIGVVGRGKQAAKEALFLRTYSNDVTLFAAQNEINDQGLSRELREASIRSAGKPRHIRYSEGLITIETKAGEIEVDVLYPAMGCRVRSELAIGVGAECDEQGNLKVDGHQHTTVAGLYAAGDVVSDLHQLTVATGHAALAAPAIHNSLPRNFR